MLSVPELSKIIKDNRTKLREWGGGQIPASVFTCIRRPLQRVSSWRWQNSCHRTAWISCPSPQSSPLQIPCDPQTFLPTSQNRHQHQTPWLHHQDTYSLHPNKGHGCNSLLHLHRCNRLVSYKGVTVWPNDIGVSLVNLYQWRLCEGEGVTFY